MGCTSVTTGSVRRPSRSARAALGLFPAVALINHACDSNCLYTSAGHRMVVRAVRDVAQGEELTISYAPVYKSAAERRALLLQQIGRAHV